MLEQLNKRWQRNEFHLAWLKGEPLFPLTVTLPKITGRKILHDFGPLQEQLARLVDLCSQKGLHMTMQEFHFSLVGRQRLPVAIQIPSMDILVKLLGQKSAWQAFLLDITLVRHSWPELENWLCDEVALVVRHQGKWPRLLAVCRYFQQHPRPLCYLRQIDIPGVDSKFIENNKPVLKSLLDKLLPPEVIDDSPALSGKYAFEQRYGILHDMPSVRFRLLDEQMTSYFSGLSDFSTPVEQMAELKLPIECVIITENKTNFLALPAVYNSIAIFGLGYGVQLLKKMTWLMQVRILYWGDIDTNGFAILSQLRSYFPHVESLLMDEETLLECRDMWGEEPAEKVCRASRLAGLHPQEQLLYDKLKQNAWQPNLRLEQEYVPFHRLQLMLARMSCMQ